jgi:hypothetical protein
MPEMQILNALEQSEFDSPPEFDSANRKKHFDFPLGILELVEQLRTPTNKACFLLSSGYFSATKKFYAPQQFRQLDIEYVCGKVGLNPQDVNFVQYDKQTLLRHEQMILIFYGFKPFNARAAPFVEREIENLVALELKPRLVFYRVVDLLVGGKIAVPNYHRLSDLILRSLRGHKLKMVQTIELHLSSEIRSLLDSLFEKAIDPQRASNRYRLTLLKKCSQSTKPGRIKETVEDFQVIKTLHLQVQNVLQSRFSCLARLLKLRLRQYHSYSTSWHKTSYKSSTTYSAITTTRD